MKTEHSNTSEELQIRALLDARVTAVCAKDIDTLVSHCAPDILSFDVVNSLQSRGSDAIGTRLREWFSSFQGPIAFEFRDLAIAANGDVAFCCGLSHVNGTRTDGGTINMWYRTTICYRKVNEEWLITHEHDSVPFSADTGKPSLDLEP